MVQPSDETRQYFEDHPRFSAGVFLTLGVLLIGLSWYGFTHTDPYRSGVCLFLACLMIVTAVTRFVRSLDTPT